MKLLIVESPGKTKKIKGFLGSGWEVEASFGHVRDLPLKEMGVDPQSFTPTYEPTEQGLKRIKMLRQKAGSAEEVYLATDPDREGEAIAWHLKEVLSLDNPKRITFTEITEKAVKAALDAPRAIDMNLVHAQEGRRVLDRLVGFSVSPLLGHGRSAGRVQSPAVKIVTTREREIAAFKVTTHYGVLFTFEAVENISSGWAADWKSKNFLGEGQEYILDKTLAQKISEAKYFIVSNYEDSESRKGPAAPFTTSTLQQVASQRLKFSPKKTMDVAQRLYDAGLISYMRTDAPNLSTEAVMQIREFCRSHDLPLSDEPRTYKSKAGAQEAHEGIRPIHFDEETAGEGADERSLYNLIRLRAIASQMADAVYAVRKVELIGEETVDEKEVRLEGVGRTLIKPGWKVLEKTADEEDSENPNPIPQLRTDSRLFVQKSEIKTKQTKPPTRFTEATLVKQLENARIGRPATYAAILDNIIARKAYLEVDKKRYLIPTKLGFTIVDALDGSFNFMNLDFTKLMEELLDKIAEGQSGYLDVIKPWYTQLETELAAFTAKRNFPCPKCGKTLTHIVKKPGKDGKGGYNFWGCTGYPACSYAADDVDEKPGAERVKDETGYFCQECKAPLIRQQGKSKKTGKAYDFFSCSAYPKCQKSYPRNDDGTPNFEINQA